MANHPFLKITFAFLLILFGSFNSIGQAYFDLSTGNYSETFTNWTNPSTNFWSAVPTSSGSIPSPTSVTTSSANFTTGTTGGIQNGSNSNIQFLSTGTTENSSAVALDLNLNFSNRNAGNISFDATTIFNQTGNRAGSLRVFYATNGTNWSELTGINLPFTANNNVSKASSISLSLPTVLNNQPTVKLRFYLHNGGPALPTPTGSRPKIAIDNMVVTSVSAGPSLSLNKSIIANLNYFTGNGPSVSNSYLITGQELTGDITITAPTNFKISKTSATEDFENAIIISPTSGSINSQIYVQLISGLSPNGYNGVISHTGGGIIDNPTLEVSGTVSNIVLPSSLKIVSITPSSPLKNEAFNVSIQAVDDNQLVQNVSQATEVSLSVNNGTGVLSGTLSGIIPVGANNVTITGIIYDKEENNVSLTATATSGDALLPANSSVFNVIYNAFPNEIKSIASGNWSSTSSWDCNCIPTLSNNVRVRNPNNITVTTSATNQGAKNLVIDYGANVTIENNVNFKINSTLPVSTNINLAMGNPSGATNSVNDEHNYLLEKDQYVMSYNRSRGTSNWVSWYLNDSSTGSTNRQDDFRPDTSLPSGWYLVDENDYSGSGFDRGHMTPSGDRTSSIPDNSATFLMTNMIPQAPANNQGPWNDLEVYLRNQRTANGGQEIYIIAGSYGIGGTGTNGPATKIANNQVTVPSFTYKIAVILSNGIDDVARVQNNTRVIAVIMPNSQSIINNWRTYRTTIDEIEGITGHDFLSNVPENIQAIIEGIVDAVAN